MTSNSNPNFRTGQIPTAVQWNADFGEKIDATNGTSNNQIINNPTINGTVGGSPSFAQLNATALAATSTTARSLVARFAEVANVMDFGAVGDGVTDDSVAIQAAANALATSGGRLHFPSRQNFFVTKTIFLYSNTTVSGYGATITATSGTWNNPSFTPASDGFVPGRQIFCNVNWNVSSQTDSNIAILGVNFQLQAATLSQRRGGTLWHYVQNVRQEDCTVTGGGGSFSHVACDSTSVKNCLFLNIGYSAADHWSGSTNNVVTGNIIKCDPVGMAGAPAIQYTGSTSLNTAAISAKFICTNNIVYGGSPSTYSVGLTETDATSVANDVIIANNIIDMTGFTTASGAIGLYGGGDNWQITGNIIQNVTDGNCISVTSNGYGTPTRAHVAGNRILDSSRTSGGATILNILANSSTVIDNDIINCTCTTPIAVVGTNCVVRNGVVDPGSGGSRGSVSGSGSVFVDYAQNGAMQVRTTSGANYLELSGRATGFPPRILAKGSDTDVSLGLHWQGAGHIEFEDSGGTVRHQFDTTYAQLSMASGGSPAFKTTGVGSQVNLITATGAVTTANPFLTTADSSDSNVALKLVGKGTSGILGQAYAPAATPTTSDIPAGYWAVWKDTSGGTIKLYYNDAGSLKSVALA